MENHVNKQASIGVPFFKKYDMFQTRICAKNVVDHFVLVIY